VGQPKIRVAVVFGGRSTEHAVSCASAGLILSAIDPDRYEVLPIGIATDGRWVLTSGDPARLALSSGSVPSVESVAVGDGEIVSRAGPSGSALQVLSPGSVPRDLGSVDVVLPLLHGTYGEDGTLQGLLEMTGTRYVGAGVFASAAGMDKEYMKLLMSARGLPVGRYVVVRDRDWRAVAERKRIMDEIAELGWPVFVKPARGGSSIGITRVSVLDDVEPAIEAARAHDPKVLVEAAVGGIEVECAVLEGLEGGPPEASVPGQVIVDPASDFYDFEAKYLASATTMRIPAPVPVEAASEIRRMACAAFDAISCEGLARVDFFYTPAGQVLVNEINTMPGMTPASGFPMMWAASGLPLPQLVDRIIQTALRKRPGRRLALAGAQTAAGGVQGFPGCCPRPLRCCAVAYFLGFSPLTSALKSAPARNLGTEELGTWMVAPVAGLRAVRAGRSLFSKTPNPVMATLSPLATADWMVSSTAFTASVADFLSPSRPEIASIRSRLFMVHSCASPTGRVGSETRSRPLTCPKVGDQTPLHNNLGHIGPRVGEYHTPQHPAGIRKVSKFRLCATVRSRPRSERNRPRFRGACVPGGIAPGAQDPRAGAPNCA
jgi:D-alanine-D-alanine ligase